MSTVETRETKRPSRQAVVGVVLAAVLIVCFIGVQLGALFLVSPAWSNVPLVLAIFAVLCWLYVGLFIVAHDAMHGSLAPGYPRLNRGIGRLCVGLYACFSFEALRAKHLLHHRHAGTAGDPDFATPAPVPLPTWYLNFFLEYFSWWQLGAMGALFFTLWLLLGAALGNVVLFWALPSLASSLQLFYFGTFLPHVCPTHL